MVKEFRVPIACALCKKKLGFIGSPSMGRLMMCCVNCNVSVNETN